MFSTDDFFAYTGATPAPKKTSVTPSKKNLAAIRQKVVINYSKPITHTITDINPFPDAVNILSDEFMNGGLKASAKFSNPQPRPAPPQPPIIKNAGELFPRVNAATQARNTAIIAAVTKPIELVIYSDASFAIFGTTDKTATKKYKDDLQSLGGKFNNWLNRNGEPTPGYIFPMWRIDNVKKYLERF